MASLVRPSKFDDVVGQQDVIGRLRIMVAGCQDPASVMPHVLIDGPPGLGKTTLAGAIANELDVDLVTCNAASLRSIKSIIPSITTQVIPYITTTWITPRIRRIKTQYQSI